MSRPSGEPLFPLASLPRYQPADLPERTEDSIWTLCPTSPLPPGEGWGEGRPPEPPRAREHGLSPHAVAALLRHTLRPTDSLFHGVHRVPADLPRIHREHVSPQDEDHLAEELLSAASDAVRTYVHAGVREVSLSGGVDSAALCAIAAREAPGRVRAWTMDVHFADATERANARHMARYTGVELVDVPVPDAVLPNIFEAAVHANETVILNARAVASFAFYAEARRMGASPVMLSGAGADEVLMGNPGALASALSRVEEDRSVAAEVLRGDFVAATTGSAVEKLGTTLTPSLSRGERGDCAPWDLETSDPNVSEELRHAAWVLRELVLPPELRGARAHGITVRTPYLHPRFADVALSLPTSVLVRDGFGKWLFRHAVRSLVPDEVRLARKTPRYGHTALSSPVRDRWLELYRAWLSPHRMEPLQVIDPSAVLRVLDRYTRLSAEDPRAGVLDRLLMRLVSLAMLQAHAEARAPCPEF